MPVRAVFLDVGETLVDETRDWEAWADFLGVPRFTLLGVLGGIAGRGEHHLDVFTRLAPGLDVAAADAERRARGLFDGYGPQDLYPDALPCLRALKAAGFRVGIAGNQPAEVEEFLRELDAPIDVVASSTFLGRREAVAGVLPPGGDGGPRHAGRARVRRRSGRQRRDAGGARRDDRGAPPARPVGAPPGRLAAGVAGRGADPDARRSAAGPAGAQLTA